jgi:hypothetical protein
MPELSLRKTVCPEKTTFVSHQEGSPVLEHGSPAPLQPNAHPSWLCVEHQREQEHESQSVRSLKDSDAED